MQVLVKKTHVLEITLFLFFEIWVFTNEEYGFRKGLDLTVWLVVLEIGFSITFAVIDGDMN